MFGAGLDSPWWAGVARAEFVEDDTVWAAHVGSLSCSVHIHEVRYSTQRRNWRADLERGQPPALLGAGVVERLWPVVLVDGPASYDDDTPGRVQSLTTAAALSPRIVFVHDCDRELESTVAVELFGAPTDRIGSLWRFGPAATITPPGSP